MAIFIEPRAVAGGPTASVLRMRIVATGRKYNVLRAVSREQFIDHPAGRNGVFGCAYGFNEDATNFLAVADTVPMQHIMAEKEDKRLRLYFFAHLDFYSLASLELSDSQIGSLRRRVYVALS